TYDCLQSDCWLCSHLLKCSCKGKCYQHYQSRGVPLHLYEALEDPTLQRAPPLLPCTSTSTSLALTTVTFLHCLFYFLCKVVFMVTLEIGRAHVCTPVTLEYRMP